ANFGPGAFDVDFTGSSPAVTLMTHRYDPPAIDTREEMANGSAWVTSMPAPGSAVVDGSLLWGVDEGEVQFYGPGCTAHRPVGTSFEKKYRVRPRRRPDVHYHEHSH